MIWKNPQKSIIKPKLFKIPIDEYEEDMETELAKGKKNEILDLLKNYNKLRSEKEFNEIKYELYRVCKEGDVDSIKIYLSEKIENETNRLQFKIDSTNRTASLFEVDDYINEVIIPRTVEHESVEYLITSITSTCRFLKKLKFVENSAVKTIYGYAFPVFSNIKEIYFPASLKELKEGWCCETEKLTKITISPSNSQFKMIEDKYLIGKSDPNKDEFDELLFICRDVEEISIPSNIKIISSFAFEHCKKLTKVEISTNSNLQTIERHAFSLSKIKSIFIPPKVSKICEYAFYYCFNLTKVEIPFNSNLQSIESNAFVNSKINEIFIPSKVSEISNGAFHSCYNLKIIEISEESKIESFPLSAFDKRLEYIIMIPASLRKLIHTNKPI